MKILYFNNGSGLGTAKSGGTTRLIETARRMIESDASVSIVTTIGAFRLFESENLAADYFLVRASLLAKAEKNSFGRMWSYLISTIHAIFIIPRLPICDVVYSPSDYFCDVIPAVAYKLFRPRVAFVSMVHHLCRHPRQRRGSFFFNWVSYLGQRLSFWMITRYANLVFVYDTPEGGLIRDEFLRRGVSRVEQVANGVAVSTIDSTPAGEKKFDACFVGGLRASKGIYDLIEVWKRITASFPAAKLAVIGEGAPSITEDFRSQLSAAGLLDDNVVLLGALPSLRLYEIMKSSTVFISTSHEEGWGIAVCEALACGMPVVAFSLPAFGFLKSVIDEVTPKDYEALSRKVVFYLENESIIKKRAEYGRTFIKRFDWDIIAATELTHLESVTHDVSV